MCVEVCVVGGRMETEFEKFALDKLKNGSRIKIELPEGKELLMYLHNMMLVTGRGDVMFCNAFLQEAIQLLANAIFLYEDGYFDCAFYSVRQASEVFDTMLYLVHVDEEKRKKWNIKERFPGDFQIREKLKTIDEGYQEFVLILDDYFQHHRELIKRCHKIVHKQGLDTFYITRMNKKVVTNEEQKLFVETIKYTIGVGIIIYVILDPISLLLVDEENSSKLYFDPMTEAMDSYFFEEQLGLTDIVDRMLKSNYYGKFKEPFQDKESMNTYTYSVIRENAWVVENLDDVEKQLSMLNLYEQFMFKVLKAGIRVTNFYYMNGFMWYFTTYKSRFSDDGFGTDEIGKYAEGEKKFNQVYRDHYLSVVIMYDDKLVMEHDEYLSDSQIAVLNQLEQEECAKYKVLNEIIDKYVEELKDSTKEE